VKCRHVDPTEMVGHPPRPPESHAQCSKWPELDAHRAFHASADPPAHPETATHKKLIKSDTSPAECSIQIGLAAPNRPDSAASALNAVGGDGSVSHFADDDVAVLGHRVDRRVDVARRTVALARPRALTAKGVGDPEDRRPQDHDEQGRQYAHDHREDHLHRDGSSLCLGSLAPLIAKLNSLGT